MKQNLHIDDKWVSQSTDSVSCRALFFSSSDNSLGLSSSARLVGSLNVIVSQRNTFLCLDWTMFRMEILYPSIWDGLWLCTGRFGNRDYSGVKTQEVSGHFWVCNPIGIQLQELSNSWLKSSIPREWILEIVTASVPSSWWNLNSSSFLKESLLIISLCNTQNGFEILLFYRILGVHLN